MNKLVFLTGANLSNVLYQGDIRLNPVSNNKLVNYFFQSCQRAEDVEPDSNRIQICQPV